MGSSRCRVSYTDQAGLEHSAEVVAETLFLAIALAVNRFRNCGLAEADLNVSTKLKVEVLSDVRVVHTVELSRVRQYGRLETGAAPAEISRRNQVRKLLEL